MGREKTKYNITIPTSWEEINLETFIKLQSLYADGNKPSIQNILSILSNQSIEEVNKYPALVMEKIMEKLTYLSEPITDVVSNKVIIDDVTYQINYLEELKFGEYVDVNMILDADKSNYAALLAILCRKENEIYNDDFIAKELPKRLEMFNKQPITKIYPTISFFLHCNNLSENNMKSYLEMLKDQANRIVTHYINSLKNGVGKRLYLNYQMMKLRRLKKQLNNI